MSCLKSSVPAHFTKTIQVSNAHSIYHTSISFKIGREVCNKIARKYCRFMFISAPIKSIKVYLLKQKNLTFLDNYQLLLISKKYTGLI